LKRINISKIKRLSFSAIFSTFNYRVPGHCFVP